MATWWRLAAVMGTASLQRPAVIAPEDRRIPRSGCIEEKTNSMHQASSGGAKREAVVARNPEMFGCAGARSSKVQESPHRKATGACEQEFRGSAPHVLIPSMFTDPSRKSRCASRAAGSRLGLLSKALPNPSIVGADPNLSHRADPILSQGRRPAFWSPAVDKFRCWPGSLTSSMVF